MILNNQDPLLHSITIPLYIKQRTRTQFDKKEKKTSKAKSVHDPNDFRITVRRIYFSHIQDAQILIEVEIYRKAC